MSTKTFIQYFSSILSKIAEDFVKPAKVDIRQFSTLPASCTTNELLSMLHLWLSATDGNGTTVTTILFDFRKAFDLQPYELPTKVLAWITKYILPCQKTVSFDGGLLFKSLL